MSPLSSPHPVSPETVRPRTGGTDGQTTLRRLEENIKHTADPADRAHKNRLLTGCETMFGKLWGKVSNIIKRRDDTKFNVLRAEKQSIQERLQKIEGRAAIRSAKRQEMLTALQTLDADTRWRDGWKPKIKMKLKRLCKTLSSGARNLGGRLADQGSKLGNYLDQRDADKKLQRQAFKMKRFDPTIPHP